LEIGKKTIKYRVQYIIESILRNEIDVLYKELKFVYIKIHKLLIFNIIKFYIPQGDNQINYYTKKCDTKS
jgi:hypothetical protein